MIYKKINNLVLPYFIFFIIFNMCGIVSIISKKKIAVDLINCLKQLQNRGYDSAGLCILNKKIFSTLKFASTEELDSIKKLGENNLSVI